MYFDVATKVFREEEKDPGKLALAGSDRELTWEGLKILSDKICERLQQASIPPGNPVLVYGDKEVFFLASILSCYRLNLPFVPLSPELPAKRIEKIIQQTAANVILVCGNYEDAPVLPVTLKSDSHAVSASLVAWPGAYIGTAYILFTSGTSGEPKGVLIDDQNLVSFINWFKKDLPVSENSVIINQASFLFDISLADLFGILQLGGTVILNSAAQVRDGSFFDRIKKYQGNYWNSTPSFLSLCFTNKQFTESFFPSINCFTLSGENLSSALVKELQVRFPKATIINAYGPTETCIFASCAIIRSEMLNENFLPISTWPSENISIEQDEIIISGPQVGKGYLHGDAFLGKFYTGDFAEVKNGLLYCRGRRDEQIKLNGYRIELGEIKAALETFDAIRQAECVPVAVDGKIKRLLAFVRLKENVHNSAEEIKHKLHKLLPQYMIPGEIVLIDAFPMNSSGKTDKEKLLRDHLNNSK